MEYIRKDKVDAEYIRRDFVTIFDLPMNQKIAMSIFVILLAIF